MSRTSDTLKDNYMKLRKVGPMVRLVFNCPRCGEFHSSYFHEDLSHRWHRCDCCDFWINCCTTHAGCPCDKLLDCLCNPPVKLKDSVEN